MVWIAAIADEVVSVLQVSASVTSTSSVRELKRANADDQSIGELMGLSDAIIGLTSQSCLFNFDHH